MAAAQQGSLATSAIAAAPLCSAPCVRHHPLRGAHFSPLGSPCWPAPPLCTAPYCPLQLLYNFIYKEPSAANFSSVLGALDLLRFICSRDQTIAQVGAAAARLPG